jgi:hypothetical protein
MMKFLSPVRNLETARKIDEIVSWAVRCQIKPRPYPFEIVLFKLTDWIAVPLTPEIFYDDLSVLKNFQKTLTAHGYNQLYATQLCTRDYDSHIVPATCEGLDEFLRALSYTSGSALFMGEEEPDWILINMESEFFVIAGARDFIYQMLSGKIEEAFSRFQDFVLHEQISQEMTQYLQSVYDQLKNNYPKAENGDEFRL